MTVDIFEFWSRIADDAFVHPDDAAVFERQPGWPKEEERLGERPNHNFNLDCLPIGFFGPLRTAKVVLLFLSPGYDPFDTRHAQTPEGRAYYREQRAGLRDLPSVTDHEGAHLWWTRVVRQFDAKPEALADRIAILNIGAYHSRKFHDWHLLTALQSSRVALDHAQRVLFPQAEAGERVVVCLRSARLWGLSRGQDDKGSQLGQSLFVPSCTPGGMMHHGEVRIATIAAVRAALEL
ncbi:MULTISPECIES: hypothetical protein [unclassified Methylobacterium]|uniref:hypothetical protein n=1 Tax=unclassified Methylobacterium TaxID=2615210 RepID=UPI0011C1E363|nr:MULTISPECIES: hypothetical protein [unclassified Methylobacterium]QEE41547.1 hypothetical protein FVA80_23980 [Methylobacterium sp. WL1]TXN57075.1 hypothetical protein FV241_12705 [Methylobacterium sp. WL2]